MENKLVALVASAEANLIGILSKLAVVLAFS